MFERFTERARHCVVLAQDEARLLDHDHIGTEHILLGLLHEPSGVAAQALRSLGVSLEAVRADVEGIVGRGPTPSPAGHISFTPRAKKVLELSLREALQLGHNYIGTEHILLGLVREGEGLAAQVLVGRGVDLPRVRDEVVRLVGAEEPRRPAGGRRTPAAEEAFEIAAGLAGGGPVGTHHLLEALARTEDALAARVLVDLGVDTDALAARIDELSTDGTGDETPEQAALRRLELRIEGDELHIVVRDPDTVERAKSVLQELDGGPITGEDPLTTPLAGIWYAVQRAIDDLRLRLSIGKEADERGIRRAVRRAIEARLRRRGP